MTTTCKLVEALESVWYRCSGIRLAWPVQYTDSLESVWRGLCHVRYVRLLKGFWDSLSNLGIRAVVVATSRVQPCLRGQRAASAFYDSHAVGITSSRRKPGLHAFGVHPALQAVHSQLALLHDTCVVSLADCLAPSVNLLGSSLTTHRPACAGWGRWNHQCLGTGLSCRPPRGCGALAHVWQ